MPETTFSAPEIHRLADWLKVLAEPNRLRLLNLLVTGVQCNCELSEALQLAPNLISHHLSTLREAGLVDMKRDQHDARWVYYSVNRGALEALNSAFGAFFNLERIQTRPSKCAPKSQTDALSEGNLIEKETILKLLDQ